MFNLLGAANAGLNIFEKMVIFFASLREFVIPEYVLYGGVGLLCLMILVTLAVSGKTYEVKVLKFVKNSNKYFKKNPQINEDNLIFVNNTFKKAPKNLRYSWQQYMLNRDKLPSDYINTRTCVDQPLKSSAHDNTSKVLQITTVMIAIATFIINLCCMLNNEQANGSTELYFNQANSMNALGWLYVFIIPCLIYLIGMVVVIIMKARHTAIIGDLYTEFQDFERYMNKACSTMPSYIDYEVLFTRKEIRDGIPALQEYLEKRALQEQKEREEAELKNLNFEEFDFTELGIENSLLLERALRESEKFFNIKKTLGERISAKQTEMTSYQKNFDEVTKEFEKKAQAFRENLKQLNEQLNSTSVNIEANYIKKRYREDQQKLQQLEKDYEIASIRFNKQQTEINSEIENLRKDIQYGKEDLERAMTEEGKTYANKIYGIINNKVVDQNRPIFEEQQQQIAEMTKEIETLTATVNENQAKLSDMQVEKEKLNEEINIQKFEIEAIKNVREYLTSPEFRQVVIDRKKARKESGIDGLSIEELRDRAATAEEQLRIANERQQQLEKNEEELMKRLRRMDDADKRSGKTAKKASTADEVSYNPEVQPSPVKENIAEVNKNIREANTSLQKNEEELMGKISNTLAKLEEVEAKPEKQAEVEYNPDKKAPEAAAPEKPKAATTKKKSSLSALSASVSKLKSKTKK